MRRGLAICLILMVFYAGRGLATEAAITNSKPSSINIDPLFDKSKNITEQSEAAAECFLSGDEDCDESEGKATAKAGTEFMLSDEYQPIIQKTCTASQIIDVETRSNYSCLSGQEYVNTSCPVTTASVPNNTSCVEGTVYAQGTIVAPDYYGYYNETIVKQDWTYKLICIGGVRKITRSIPGSATALYTQAVMLPNNLTVTYTENLATDSNDCRIESWSGTCEDNWFENDKEWYYDIGYDAGSTRIIYTVNCTSSSNCNLNANYIRDVQCVSDWSHQVYLGCWYNWGHNFSAPDDSSTITSSFPGILQTTNSCLPLEALVP